jgi:perosamine synthetase
MFHEAPQNKWSYDIPRRAINLPSYHDITKPELLRVPEVIIKLTKA